MITLCNAFSLNMLGCDYCDIHIQKASANYVSKYIGNDYVQNAIGHKETDNVVRNMINNDNIPEGERLNVSLNELNTLVVAQYRGPRLPEGTTELPEGATIEFYIVKIKE